MRLLTLWQILGRPDANGGCFGCGCLSGCFWIVLAGGLLWAVLTVWDIHICDLAYIGGSLCGFMNWN